MRKTDVFGKKTTNISIVYLLFSVFIVVLSGYFILSNTYEKRLDELIKEQQQLESSINAIIVAHQSETYHQIGEIIQFLPTDYNQVQINNELDFVRNISNMTLAESVSISFITPSPSPFNDSLPETIEFVSIQLSMTIGNPDDILLFLDNLIEMDRFYFVYSLNISFLSNGKASVVMNIYTFYNNVII